MAEAMTQVNVRMSSRLKQAGDSAFTSAGLSPSDVIRAVYRRAAELAHTLRSVSDIVTTDSAALDARDERARKLVAFEQSGHTFDDAVSRLGLQVNPSDFAPMTEDEVEDAFYQDFLASDAP